MSKILPFIILLFMYSTTFGQDNFDLQGPEYELFTIELTPLLSSNIGKYISFEQEYKSGNTSYIIDEINTLITSLDTVRIETPKITKGEEAGTDVKAINHVLSSTRDFLSQSKEQLKHRILAPGEKDRLYKLVFHFYMSAYNRQYWFTFPAITFQKDFSFVLYEGCMEAYKILFLNLSAPLFSDTTISFYQEYTNIDIFTARLLLKELNKTPAVLADKNVSKFKGFLEDIISRKVGLMYRVVE